MAKRGEAPAAMETKWYKTVGNALWAFFNSLKLTVFVLITLATVSIIGTVIEQNKPITDYLKAYGEQWTRVIVATRLYDMFHSWWFITLLVALTLNIIVCTLERFPPKWRNILAHKPSRFDPRVIENCSHQQSVSFNGGADAAADELEKIFKARRFKFISAKDERGRHYYAWKGVIGRFGSDFTHVSLLLILLGAIVGGFTGFKDFKVIYVGDTVKVPNEEFNVRLDKFWIDYYETGQIRQYNSMLTVLEGGKEVLTKQVWVNEPLYYNGVRFYQSSFGSAWDKVDEARLSFVKGGSNKPEKPFAAKWGELTKVPGSRYSVKVIGFAADFAYDEASGTVFSKSAEGNNPAVNLEIYEGDKLISTPWLFMKYPGIFPAIIGSEDDIVFTVYKPVLYSGLSLNKDPGTNIVWAGALVMGLGFVFAFFVYHRRVWVHIKDSGGSAEIKMGGLVNKNSFAFEKELADIVDGLRSGKKRGS